MAEKYKAPKGTYDLMGAQARGWEFLLSTAREVFSHYGYEPLYTPIIEHTEVFTRGIGEATDVVGKEMYTFEDKAGRSLSLRPEGTASAVRAAINANITSNERSAKLYYAGPMFRYENVQKGRQRQFYQIGAEALGLSSPEADAEMIIMLWHFFTKIGLPKDSMRLLVNSMGDNECRPAYRDKVASFIREHSEELCGECNNRANTNPLRAFDCKNPACREVFKSAPLLKDELCDECAHHHARVLSLLDAAGIPYVEDPTLVRGLDYYTRTVFEIQVDNGLGSQNAIGGGGRYDGLFESLGGKKTPGLGFALGFERTLLALEAAGITFEEGAEIDVYVAVADDSFRDDAFKLTMELREAGIGALVDVMNKSLRAQFKQADHAHARYTAIFAPDEFAEGKIRLRNMATKEEELVGLKEVASALQ